ncbi:MAG: tRNA pseudouridine(38-40) synthase TruA [Bacteroidota bacterium]
MSEEIENISPVRYFLDISYLGTQYAGWQIQPNALTVQEVLEKALQTYFGEPVSVLGAGRTDSGVHARQLLVHFHVDVVLSEKTRFGLNGILPHDISVNGIYTSTQEDFHARFDAISRAYCYRISTHKSPLDTQITSWIRRRLDVEAMNTAAKALLDYKDFASFCKLHGDQKTTLCDMHHAYWTQKGNLLTFHVQANRFLRGMVRALVGTLIWVGEGRISIPEFISIIEAKDRAAAGPNVEAKGLTLEKVNYPVGSFTLVG